MAIMRPMRHTYIQRLMKSEKRNARIRRLREQGATFAQLAKQFNITRARAHVICAKRK